MINPMGKYHLDMYVNMDKDLTARANWVWTSIYDVHQTHALAFDKLNKTYPVKYYYELHVIRPAKGEYSLKLIYYETQVLKHLRLLTQSESETLVELLMSKDVSNQLVALAILKNKLKEKKALEKKGTFAKEFAEITSNYPEIVINPGNNLLLEFKGKLMKI